MMKFGAECLSPISFQPVLVLEKAMEDLIDFLAENIVRRHNSLSFT